MKTKLTLTVDQRIVEKAKRHVAKRSKSLSYMIENFLKSLGERSGKESVVDSSRGILKEKLKGHNDKQIREAYYQEKHGL